MPSLDSLSNFIYTIGMLLALPFLGIYILYCWITDLIFNCRREYRDRVELRRPITPTEEMMSSPVAAAPKLALSARSKPRVADQSPCLLFSLPTELRLQIWEELLAGRVMAYEGERGVDEEGVRPGLEKWRAVEPGGKLDTPWLLHAALLRTCRRVYAETIPILYHTTTFELLGYPYDIVPTRRMPRLQHLTILKRVGPYDNMVIPMSPQVFHQRPDLLTAFKRLRTVPRVDLILMARARPEDSRAGKLEEWFEWLRRTETSMLKMIERSWKGARNQYRVTVCWELSQESKARQWSFEIVEKPVEGDDDEEWLKSLMKAVRIR